MAAKKRGRPKKSSATATEIKNREYEAQRSMTGSRRQLISIILFSIAVFLLFVVLIEGQSIWKALHNFLFGVFGICAYFWPVLLGYIAILSAMDRQVGRVISKVWQAGVLIVLFGAAINIFTTNIDGIGFGSHLVTSYKLGVDISGGGFLGGLIGYPLNKFCGKFGAGVIVCILIFVFFMLVTGTTLITLFRLLAKPVKKIGEQAEIVYAGNIEKREQRRLQFDQEGTAASRFNIDIPLDDTPLKKNDNNNENLADKQRRLINTYRDLDSDEKGSLSKSKTKGSSSKSLPVDDGVLEKFQTGNNSKNNFTVPTGSGIVLESSGSYRYPPLSLLAKPEPEKSRNITSELEATATRLVDTLRSFGVETRVIDISRGPSVTRYELQPSAGVKISKITNLADDIALNLATAGVRIEAPIPNKPAVGIEVPNKKISIVGVREIIDSNSFATSKSKLSIALGKDIAGNPTIANIAKMPHGLIAGATGSGKSVCINSIIISILYKATPDEVKLLMIDPKIVELGVYNGIPHLLVPVVTDPRKAAGALGWAVTEMEKRYKLFAENNVRDLNGYNRLADKNENIINMPHIVIIIDELADLMMTAPNEVEDSICRIAQKARAAGMHLIIATQRPSVDVITGIIKANIPTRIAFSVSSQVDSRTILDMGGAEKLMGRGDMLFHPVGAAKPKRVQGCFVSDDEVEAVVNYIKGEAVSDYDEEVMNEIERQAVKEKSTKNSVSNDDADPMLQSAIECVVDIGQASTSMLQRRLKLGYARAARIIDEMEQRGIVGPFEGSKPRQVLITKPQLLEMQARSEE